MYEEMIICNNCSLPTPIRAKCVNCKENLKHTIFDINIRYLLGGVSITYLLLFVLNVFIKSKELQTTMFLMKIQVIILLLMELYLDNTFKQIYKTSIKHIINHRFHRWFGYVLFKVIHSKTRKI